MHIAVTIAQAISVHARRLARPAVVRGPIRIGTTLPRKVGRRAGVPGNSTARRVSRPCGPAQRQLALELARDSRWVWGGEGKALTMEGYHGQEQCCIAGRKHDHVAAANTYGQSICVHRGGGGGRQLVFRFSFTSSSSATCAPLQR